MPGRVDRRARFRWDLRVPEYDAFGREIGENTLGGLAGEESKSGASAQPAREWTPEQLADATSYGASPTPTPTSTPTPVARPQPEPQATPQPQPAQFQQPQFEQPRIQSPAFQPQGIPGARRRRSGVGCLVGLVILAAIIAIPVFAVVSVVDDASDTIDKVTGTIDDFGQQPAEPGKPPAGIAGRSMVAPANFAKAVQRLERSGMGQITLLRLAPERLDVQVAKGGRERSAQITYAGRFTRGPAVGGSSATPLAYADIEPGAPARLVRGSRRFGVRPRGINYLVLMDLPGIGKRWVAYFKNGVYVQGDQSGRGARKISG